MTKTSVWQEGPLTLFKERRSIRHYRPEAVPGELLEQLLTAAVWAPSAHNRQPWRFAGITGRPLKGMVLIDPVGIAEDEALKYWVDRCLDLVKTLPPK